MKLLFLFLFVINTLHADRLLLSIASKHNNDKDMYGEEFNEVNLGIGYEFDIIDDEDYLLMLDVLALKDSYSNPMYSVTVGVDHKATSWFRFGFDFGIASRKTKYVYFNKPVYFEREVIPIIFIPTATINYKKLSLSVLHIPQMDYKGKRVEGVTLTILGYSF